MIGNQGVTLFGIEYTSPLVQNIFLTKGRTEVSVRVDPKDLGWVALQWEGKWHAVKAKVYFLDKVHLTDWKATETAMREQFRGQAKLDRAMVRTALADIRSTVTAAAARLDIGPTCLTDAEIQRSRDRLFMGMTIVDQGADHGPGLLTAAVDILSDDRTDKLFAAAFAPAVASTPEITAHIIADDGGEPEIL
jgi:hypothetical protein